MAATRELLARAARGDTAARDALLGALYPEVARQVHVRLAHDLRPKHRWLLPLFSTGDIVQDVFLGVVRGLQDFEDKDDEELQRWIAAQVRHRIVDRLRFHGAARRDARREVHAEGEADRRPGPRTDPTPSLALRLDERMRLLHRALAELQGRERELWRLRQEEERGFAEVAEHMGYASSESARAAFRALRAKLVVRLRRLGLEAEAESGARG